MGRGKKNSFTHMLEMRSILSSPRGYIPAFCKMEKKKNESVCVREKERMRDKKKKKEK